jgi:hypothetical protein
MTFSHWISKRYKMKRIIIGALISLSIPSFGCDAKAAKSFLQDALRLNKILKRSDNLENAKEAATVVQNTMCKASNACEEIAHDLYFPCQQHMILTEGDQVRASRYLKMVIKDGLKAL